MSYDPVVLVTRTCSHGRVELPMELDELRLICLMANGSDAKRGSEELGIYIQNTIFQEVNMESLSLGKTGILLISHKDDKFNVK